MRTLAFITAVIVAVPSFNANAALSRCAQRDKIVTQLAKKYKEQPAVIGVSKDGRLLEVWSSYERRSFTVLMTWPTMRSCIMAVGDQVAMKKPKEFISRFEF